MGFTYINGQTTNMLLNALIVAFSTLLPEVHLCSFLTLPGPYWEKMKHCASLRAPNCKMNYKTECCIIDIRLQKDVLTSLFAQAILVNNFVIFLSLLVDETGKDPSEVKRKQHFAM
jgi:hypothetical protein